MSLYGSCARPLHIILTCLPLRFYLVSILSSVTSGMEEIVMHDWYQDMQVTYQNTLYK